MYEFLLTLCITNYEKEETEERNARFTTDSIYVDSVGK